MKKLLYAIFLIFFMVGTANAQQKKVLTAASATCTFTSCLTVSVDPTQGAATFTITANASANTISFEASGDGGTTLVPISATPSNSTSSVTGANGTGTWQVNVAGYTNLYLIMTTLVSGTTTVSIIQGSSSARGGSGGQGGGVGTTALTVIPPTTSSNSTVLTGLSQNLTILYPVLIPYTISTLSQLQYSINTPDNTANVYDFGLYGPNCLGAATNVPLVFHTGVQPGTVLAPAGGARNVTLSGAPVTVNMVPGWYCFAATSSAVAPPASFTGELAAVRTVFFANGIQPSGNSATSGGALNSTITAPVSSEQQVGGIWLSAY